ncbi:MAG: bifunctional phosphopantothenoylcysteine decarboxylase/phosphopantothenate--cysteine ligase CoaBC, partial [Saprospiraceae bacterium]
AGIAGGFGHNLLLGCYLSAKCPVIIAPAMDLDMWRHPAVKNNLRLVQSYGNQIIPVGNGFLASGLEGDGRMAEPEEILDNIHHFFAKNLDLKNKSVLITAGPTFEAIDPVRFIGNHSSGKMGIELAKSCANRGANVTLILGPTSLTLENPSIKVERIQSAQEMYDAVNQCFEQSDIAIFAAAVADYRPATVSLTKIKKKDDDLSIPLVKTIDIAATIGAKKSDKQILVGFALETNDEIINANSKLHKKNLDFIVLNSLADQGAGFKHDTNKVTIIDSEGTKIDFPLKSKKDVANDIIDYLVSKIKMDV